jgi:hypothetical protein
MFGVPARWRSVILALIVVLIVAAAAAPAVAFPGVDGLLAVTPVRGNGVVLMSSGGSVPRRICPV